MNLFDISGNRTKLEQLEKQTLEQNFWENSQKSANVLKQINNIKSKIEKYEKINSELQGVLDIIELLSQEQDDSLLKEAEKTSQKLKNDIAKLEINTLLSGKYDFNNAIITLHSGAGGTEAQDWVQMLYRMYSRWCNSNDYKITVLDYLEGEEAGIKSITALVTGEYAYGYLKGEQGVHRLVRISPFDSGRT